MWNLSNQSCVFKIDAHKGFVRGVSFTKEGDGFLSCGDDKSIKLWELDYVNKNWKDASDIEVAVIQKKKKKTKQNKKQNKTKNKKKVKVISRNAEEYTRERSQDIYKVSKNISPSMHPFEKAREYTRALNATKLERVFAKPFVGALSGHRDGVYCMAKHASQMTCVLSGAGDN